MGKLMNRGRRPRQAMKLVGALAVTATVTAPHEGRAQALDIDFAVEQAFTTLHDMGTPTGYRIGVGIPRMLGPLGFEIGYRTVRERLGEQAQRCGLSGCVPGPFDKAMRMRAATLDVGWSTMLNPFVELSAGLTGSLAWQDIDYGPGDGADPGNTGVGTETVGPDTGLGAYATWRFPPMLSVLRPFLYTRAEWVRGGSCPADAACFGSRYLGSVGIGMYARIP